MGEKYVVRVGAEEQVFFDRRTADEWFSAMWLPGLVWEFHKYVDGSFVW